jgi:hypothetical protein
MNIILIVLLVLLLVGALPTWPYSANWGHTPSAIVAVILVLLLLAVSTGRIG